MKKIVFLVLLFITSLSFGQAIDSSRWIKNDGSFNYNNWKVRGNLVIPTKTDTSNKISGLTQIIGTDLYFVATDHKWKTYISDTSAIHNQLVNQLAAIQANASSITGKQGLLNGNGFVKATGTTMSYDNTSYFPAAGGVLSGTAGNGYIGFTPQSAPPTVPSSGFKLFASSAGAFSWLTTQGYMRELRIRNQNQDFIGYLQNKPTYTLGDSADIAAKVDKATTIKINGVTKDLSGNQDWGTYLTSESDPKRLSSIAVTGTTTKTVTATLADASTVSTTFTDAMGGGVGSAVPRLYNVKDYGATGNGVSDDQSSIQAAINAANAAGGGIVYFPNGIYILGSSVDASSGAQLYLPLSAYDRTDTARVVKLLGETSPNQYSTPLVDATSNQKMPVTGVVLQSTLQGSTGDIIGARYQTVSWGQFNFGELQLENITIRAATRTGTTNTAATQVALNGSRLAYLNVRNIRIDVQPASDSIVQPASTSVGIWMPVTNNFAFCKVDNALITGYYKGMIVREHGNCTGISIDGCYYGISLEGTNGHTNEFSRLLIQRTRTNIAVTGGSGEINIDALAIENTFTGSYWFLNVSDIEEATSTWKGLIRFSRRQSGGGSDNFNFKRTGTATTSTINTIDVTGLNIVQPSYSQTGLSFREQGVSNNAFIGRLGSTFPTNGSMAANDLLLTSSTTSILGAFRVIAASGGTFVDAFKAQSSAAGVTATVTNASTSASAVADLISSNGTGQIRLGMSGTSYAAYGALLANTPYIYAPHVNGIILMGDNPSAPIKFAPGGNTEKARFASTGNLLLGTTTDVANKIINAVSTSKASHPFPSMTAAQRIALTMTTSNYGDHVYQTDVGAGSEGVWIYKSDGWHFAY